MRGAQNRACHQNQKVQSRNGEDHEQSHSSPAPTPGEKTRDDQEGHRNTGIERESVVYGWNAEIRVLLDFGHVEPHTGGHVPQRRGAAWRGDRGNDEHRTEDRKQRQGRDNDEQKDAHV